MLTKEFDYNLPQALIAQQPLSQRDASRMMVVHRDTGSIEHCTISDLPRFLYAPDLLVLNDTRVFPARLRGVWQDTGGSVELLLVRRIPEDNQEVWRCMCGTGRPLRKALVGSFAGNTLQGVVCGVEGGGFCQIRFISDQPLMEILATFGEVPLPPYITRAEGNSLRALDQERYQTIYASETGAVAAPTAGLHFNENLLVLLQQQGVQRATVTLHVGPGTFKPVKTEYIEDHLMDGEYYQVSEKAAASIAQHRSAGGRIVAVGSTTVRTLEGVAALHNGKVVASSGECQLFIYPPYQFVAVDVMLTNFHLPQSTLLMMVSALAGKELIMRAYQEAVAAQYRFFSYGDCMLIL